MLDLFNVLKECAEGGTACSGVIGTGVPGTLVNIIHYVFLGIQIVIPILLIIFGMIELGKAITAQKEDEIKKAQGSFLKKCILAVLVFLTVTIVKFVFNFSGGGTNIWGCIDSLLNGNCM